MFRERFMLNKIALRLKYSLIGAGIGLVVVLGFGFFLLFNPVPRTPVPDWISAYERLDAEDEDGPAFDLLLAAAGASDPRAFERLAGRVEIRDSLPWWYSNTEPEHFRRTAAFLAEIVQTQNSLEGRFDGLLEAAERFQKGRRVGLWFAARDTWLWRRCVQPFRGSAIKADVIAEALAEAEGKPNRPGPGARYQKSCAARAFRFALALEAGRFGDDGAALAGDWFTEAEQRSGDDQVEIVFAYALRILDGRIDPGPMQTLGDEGGLVKDPQGYHKGAGMLLSELAIDGYGPAQREAAARLLGDDPYARPPEGFSRTAGAFLFATLAAESGGEAATLLEKAEAALSAEDRAQAEAWLADRSQRLIIFPEG